jgi:hypothetical protein
MVRNSLLLSEFDALQIDAGTALIDLSNVFVLSERGTAFYLRTVPTARASFDVSTRIQNATVVARRTFFRVGSWKGNPPGPDRPWVLSVKNCLFHDPSSRERPEAALIRASLETLGHNLASWQGDGNLLDVGIFWATSEMVSRTAHSKADVKRDWIDYWGQSRVTGTQGPSANGPSPVVQFATGDPNSGERQPFEFRLDPKVHPSVGVDFAKLPALTEQKPERIGDRRTKGE